MDYIFEIHPTQFSLTISESCFYPFILHIINPCAEFALRLTRRGELKMAFWALDFLEIEPMTRCTQISLSNR